MDPKLLENLIADGIREGLKTVFQKSYSNPLEKLVEDAIGRKKAELQSLVIDAVEGLKEPTIRVEIVDGMRKKLAKLLIERFGGELEKQVNALKSDPTTRARIVMAIETIVKESKAV